MEVDLNGPREESYVRAIGFIEQGLVHYPHSANLWTSRGSRVVVECYSIVERWIGYDGSEC